MTDKELLERLRAEVAAVTPDCWSGILARVQSPAQQPEEAPVVPMPERKRRSAWRGWVAAAAVFFLVILGGGLYATQVPGGVATLDANPSIELTVNKLGRVLSARACNPDAQLVLDGLELRNQSLQTAADAIVANMQADGYVSADANLILVTVEAGKGDARLCGRLADAVESAQTDCGMESAALAQVLEDDPALEAYASAVGVSAGKAMLIRQISAQVQDLTGSELVGLPINDLNILAASNQVELSGIESIGAASTGVYVPYDKALQAALTCCGLTTDDVTRASMRFTLIDGEMVMEFVLSDGERHYVCSVDAETTEVCRLTGDEPKRPEETEIVPVSPVVRPNSPVTPAPTPTPTPMPEPTPTPTPEPTQSPQLQAALAAREAFLNEQAVYSGYAVPTNVSYAVSELPFAHTSPVAGYTSSGFGYRLHPLENKVKFHYGTDFAANSGMAVCAFADGTVLAAGQDDGYGNYVKIRHADGYTTLYGHCSKLLVRAGETVTAGQKIALVGATGKATGPHLHFELMHDGYYCNPEFYLAAV